MISLRAVFELCCRQALSIFSARQLRIMFVLQQWNKPMMFGEQSRCVTLGYCKFALCLPSCYNVSKLDY